ncbi:MAG: DNA polymerase III subunit alpha [bacterium]
MGTPYSFVHLHLHTQYSLLDGAVHIDRLAERLKTYGMTSVAMTDHGNIFGAIDFYIKMREKGIKPIIGVEIYITEDHKNKGVNSDLYHLILLAKDQTGYKNLLKLTSIAHTDGFYVKPRIDKALLADYHNGLIAMSACLHGEIPSKLLSGNAAGAIKAVEEYREIFKDDFFLEVQSNGIKEQFAVNNAIYDISKNFHIPVVATNDVHYLDRSDAKAHDVLLCIQTKKKLTDANRMRFSTQELYLKTQEEMAKEFASHPEALESTWEIANRCNVEIEIGKFHFPKISFNTDKSYDEILREFAVAGLKELIQKHPYMKEKEQEYWNRLELELETIKQTNFSSYFLIVRDIIQYAKAHNIPTGPGRGSAAGSLVAYAIGIIGIDPIKYGLYFERFLNKSRISLPDIDMDFSADRVDEVVDYLKNKYGANKVARITSFHPLQSRVVVKDVGRVLDIPYSTVDGLTKLIPQKMPLEDAIKIIPQLSEMSKKDEKIKEMLDIALKLEGLLRDKSLHASGVVISDKPLDEYLPLYKDKTGNIVTGYEWKYVEKVGLIKFDLLALATLTVIDETKRLVKKHRNEDVDLNNIDLEDEKLYEAMQRGDSVGLFQLESTGMQNTLKKIKPSKFEDILAVNAIYRPGPMAWIDEFVKNKEKGSASHKFKALNDILKDTYGVILFQEQVMKIASEIAGFSLEEADYVRKVISKKEEENLPILHKKFVDGAVKKGVKKADAEELFSQLRSFAEYAFNKSHSAAYALVAIWTAYLKTYYTIEFMTATLSNIATKQSQKTAKLPHYVNYCRKVGINILGPDINKSQRNFSIEDNNIRFGFIGIKNIGDAAIDAIINARKDGPFESLSDFLARVDQSKVNKKVVESLIKAGAFDYTGKKRAEMFNSMDRLYAVSAKTIGQNELFKPDTVAFYASKEEQQEWTELEKLSYEKELLDVYISGTPLNNYEKELKQFTDTSLGELIEKEGQTVTVGGMLTSVKENKVKKSGQSMAFAVLSDEENAVEVVIFSSLYASVLNVIKGNKPVIVKGVVKIEEQENDSDTEDNRIVKIIAEKIFSIDQALPNLIQEVHIEADFGSLTEDSMNLIRDCLMRYRGNAKVIFDYIKENKKKYIIELPDYLNIMPDERLFAEIRSIITDARIYYNRQ